MCTVCYNMTHINTSPAWQPGPIIIRYVTHLVFVAIRVLAEDGCHGEPAEAHVEDEPLLGSDGPLVAGRVPLENAVHHGHLLLVGQETKHH